MSSQSVVCPNCGNGYKTKYLFCPNCKSNISLPEPVSVSQIAYKESIEREYFEEYQELVTRLEKLDWIDTQKKSLTDKIKSMETEKTRVDLEIDSWRHKSKLEKEDIDKLQKTSWSSFKSKLSGNFEDKLEKEQQEYELTLQQIQESEEELKEVKSKLMKLKAEYQMLTDEESKKNEILDLMTDIIFTATNGIKDEKGDEVELELSELGKAIDPYTMRKSKIQASYSLLQMSAEYLRDASIRIDEERDKNATKNALLVDALTKSDVADLRETIRSASDLVKQAFEIMYQQFDDPNADLREDEEHKGLFQGRQIWENFMRRFMSDLKKGFRNREETKKQLIQSVADINKLQAWVNSLMNDINFKIEDLMTQLRQKEQDLIRERKRVFMQFYSKGNFEDLPSREDTKTPEPAPSFQTTGFEVPGFQATGFEPTGFTQPAKENPKGQETGFSASGFEPTGFDIPTPKAKTEDEEDQNGEKEEINPEDVSDEGIRIKGMDKKKSGFNI